MARTLNQRQHSVRMDAFVDAAQRLIAARGYDAFSVQDVLDQVGVDPRTLAYWFGDDGAVASTRQLIEFPGRHQP